MHLIDSVQFPEDLQTAKKSPPL